MKLNKIYISLLLLATVIVGAAGFFGYKKGYFSAQASGNTFNYSAAAKVEKLESKAAFWEGFDAGWSDKVYKRKWRIATWKQNGNLMAKERSKENEKGYLVQTVLAGSPFSGGSIQTKKEFGYGRWTGMLKPSSEPGVLNSFFTMDWDDLKTAEKNDGTKFEVDIEFLTHTFTSGRGEVHLAIHVNGERNYYEVNVPLSFNPSDKFHVWGFDILPDKVVWHVDSKVMHTWYADKPNMIPDNYEFFINSWTKKNWINGPPEESAEYLVDWVKFTPY